MKNKENEPPFKHDKQRLEAAIEAISIPAFAIYTVRSTDKVIYKYVSCLLSQKSATESS